MKSSLPPRVYEAPNPGLLCPECHSDNTAYTPLEESWECFDCAELFTEPYEPHPIPARLFGYTEEGGHWYRKSDGSIFILTRETMQQDEDVHIRPEHGWTYYNPTEDYNRAFMYDEVDRRGQIEDFLRSLTQEQLGQLKEQLSDS